MKIKELLSEIAKKHGDGSAMLYEDMKNIEVKRIPTGLPSLDLILGGGIPEGRILEIFGEEASGKTTLGLHFLVEVQKKYPKNFVAFIDVEHAFDPEYAKVLGLDMTKVVISQPDSGEQALSIVEALAESNDVKGVVIDSVAKLIPRKEVEGNIGDAEMAGRARLMSQALRKITPLANKHECTLFFINQIRKNVGVLYGSPETTPGGMALRFDASVRIKTKTKKQDELRGETTMQTVKNKVHTPFLRTTVEIEYGKGFKGTKDLVTAAIQKEIILKSGPWYYYGDRKFRGEKDINTQIEKDNVFRREIEIELKK